MRVTLEVQLKHELLGAKSWSDYQMVLLMMRLLRYHNAAIGAVL